MPTGSATAANQVLEIAQLTAINSNTTGVSTAANQVSQTSQLSTIATATAALNQRTAGSLTPVAYDTIALTYVPSGNGAGQIETATYSLLGSQVKLVTLTYDGSNRIATVVAS